MKKKILLLSLTAMFALYCSTCTPEHPECRSSEVLCVGLVTDLNGIDDQSANQAAWEAMQQAQQDGLVDWIEVIESTDFRDYAKNIHTFTRLDYDLILTVDYNLGEATLSAALEYPDILFIGVGQSIFDRIDENEDPPENACGLIYPEDQSGFLMGALAAMMTNTGRIGAVCAHQEMPAYWGYCEGYRSGARYVNPQVRVSVVYHNDVSFSSSVRDPDWGAETATSLIIQGMDVIFGAGGETGEGAIDSAANLNTFAIGAEADQYLFHPYTAPYLLSSAVFQFKESIYALIRIMAEGDFPGGENITALPGYAPFHDLTSIVPEDVKNRMDQILTALQDGSLETGVIPRAEND